jgi:phosphoribosylanthranilate isomerase
MTQVKFCGFVRPQDVEAAVALGVHHIGLVFYANSPRALDVTSAKALAQLIPSTVETVGLFVNEQPQVIAQIALEVGLDRLQLHGDETAEQCLESARLTGLPWWRGVRCQVQADLVHSFQEFADADGFLIDSFSPLYGGTGKTFDWRLLQDLKSDQRKAIIMSGGLHAENVQEAIVSVRPMAVDVSSGIQGENPRVKDPARMAAFMAAVKSTERNS